MHTLIEDLFAYNDWSHGRIFEMCAGLSDDQLDAHREMGFGTLRATLFHNYAAEQIWMERWTGVPWRPFPVDPQSMPLDEIAQRLKQVAGERRDFLEAERSSGWNRQIEYTDSKGNSYQQKLVELLVHVANHGIHHRAQALAFLKQFGRTVPAGLDYLFFRLAYSTVAQLPDTIVKLQSFGLEINSGVGTQTAWEPERIKKFFAYSDWAYGLTINAAKQLQPALLDNYFDIGMGTIRKSLSHIYDAESWWLRNWTGAGGDFIKSSEDISIEDLENAWHKSVAERNCYVDQLTEESATDEIEVSVSGARVRFHVIESLIQLCCHSTHHRAQLINMLRHCGVSMPATDYMVWSRL